MKNCTVFTGRITLILAICLMALPFMASAFPSDYDHFSKSAQQPSVQGNVTDSEGTPLAGVHIMVLASQTGTITDIDGYFSIPADVNDTLVISAIGFHEKRITIGNRSHFDIRLSEDVTQLEGITLNAGYYTVQEKERTGNIVKMEAKSISIQPVNNPLAAMQGQLSGVNIVPTTGVPGGGYKIDIRGVNFLNGNTQPLFIIDGVPFGSQSLGATTVGGQINGGDISPLNAINPADIASIEVLKDADATAIYGSRAANGVVLISTKKGKAGKTQVKADISSTMGQVSRFLDLMDTQQYLEVRREGVTNDGFGPFLENPAFDFIWPDIKSWDNTRYTDWQEELIGGTAYRNNAQVSVSGGSENTHFLVSGSYQRETTVFPGEAHYKKATGNTHFDHSSTDGRFKINLSTLYSDERNLMPRSDFTSKAYSLEPNAPELYDAEGNINWEGNSWDNPLASLEETYTARINTLIANADLSYTLTPGLALKASLGYNTYGVESDRTLPSSARNPKLGLTPESYSSLTTNSSLRRSWIVEPRLDWKKKWSDLEFQCLVGATFQKETTQQTVLRGTGFANDQLINNLAAAKELEVLQDSDSEYAYQAIFGRMNLNWQGKYILNLTGRRDGSSRFGPGRQFGDFGAIGAAWLFSEEPFLKENPWLSFGKIRVSHGITGSDNIGDYGFLDTYQVSGRDYDGISILRPSGPFNPNFGWESNKKTELALELGFFNDRILLNGAWYQNRSSNQLTGIPLAGTTGFSSLTGNLDATVENTGFEFDLRSLNINSGRLKWSTNINLSFPRNKLVAFPGLENSPFANRYVIGSPLTIVKLYRAEGVDPQTGLYRFKDFDGDGTISSPNDKQYITDLAPEFFGGFSNTLTYKGLTLDIFFQFKKQKAFNALTYRATPGFRGNAPIGLLDRWQGEGDLASIQKATAGLSFGEDTDSLQKSSSAAISDASFIRLRNVSLNYRVPLKGKGLALDVYVRGQNLWTITNYEGPDPEQPSFNNLPQLRQLSLGVQIGL